MVGTSNLGWNGHWINITMFLRYSLATSPIPKNMWFWTWCSRLFHWSSQQLPNSAARSAVRFRPAHSHQKSHRTLMRCSPFPRIQDEVIPLSGMVPNLVPNLWLVSNFLIPNVQTSMNAFCMRIYCIHVSPNLTVSHHIPYIIKKIKHFPFGGTHHFWTHPRKAWRTTQFDGLPGSILVVCELSPSLGIETASGSHQLSLLQLASGNQAWLAEKLAFID
jgi:hypothetical protein